GFLDRAGDEVRSWFGDEDAERRRDRDMRQAGQHRGRGPKSYQRSDARIMEDVNDRLTDDPHIDASEIEVSVSNREVTLSGTVNSRFEKRHAEDIAESVSGVTHVQNNLRVQQYAEMGMGGSMLSGAGAAGAGTVGRPEMNTAGTGDTSGRKRGT
ncbi:MAG TPA: BON domain-containing protein, partial [Microvirga sp.]|nr:BON domain-containing protein [Microvirga sp.]